MANVNSVSSNSYSSSTSSIYGNRNVLTGLASGLDTESLIANSVSSYKTKISSFQQQQTKIEWKQDAYRSITDKMIDLSNKYTSYTSSTNLGSSAFFNSSVTTVVSGTYASKISAAGKTSSDIQINAVTQLATAARYSVSAADLAGGAGTAANAIDWSGSVTTSSIAGSSLTLEVAGETKTIEFGADDKYTSSDAFLAGINSKLGDTSYTMNDLKITGVSGALADAFTVNESTEEGESATYSLTDSNFAYSTTQSMSDYLSGKTIDVTLDGVTKTLTIGSGISNSEDLAASLNAQLKDAFGTYGAEDGNKVSAKVGADGKLSFSVNPELHSTMSVSSSAAEQLGFDGKGLTNYLNTGSKLSDLVGGSWADGETKSLTVNGTSIDITKDDTISSLLEKINNSGAGVTASFSTVTNEFVFNSTETGANSGIEFGGDLAGAFAGGNKVDGKDAILNVTVNGTQTTLTRSSNTVDFDGMKVTLKGTFTTGATDDPVTLTTKTNSDKIVDTIKAFVDDYNAIMKEVHSAYTTQPLSKSSGSGAYEPLTESDKEGMSDKTIEAYETKAKTGLLFGDSDLSSLYNRMRDAISSLGLADIGLSSEYDSDSKVTMLQLDEDKLRNALDSDPDKVRNAFVGTGSGDGFMEKTKKTMNDYASTSMAGYGILVQKAGTTKKSVTLLSNTLQKQIDDLDDQISQWETKMNTRIDYYTKMFSQLETLMNTMNSQSSMLSGLMGG